jgi:hypothetical protein
MDKVLRPERLETDPETVARRQRNGSIGNQHLKIPYRCCHGKVWINSA